MTRAEQISRDVFALQSCIKDGAEQQAAEYALNLLAGFLTDVARIADALEESAKAARQSVGDWS